MACQVFLDLSILIVTATYVCHSLYFHFYDIYSFIILIFYNDGYNFTVVIKKYFKILLEH